MYDSVFMPNKQINICICEIFLLIENLNINKNKILDMPNLFVSPTKKELTANIDFEYKEELNQISSDVNDPRRKEFVDAKISEKIAKIVSINNQLKTEPKTLFQ